MHLQLGFTMVVSSWPDSERLSLGIAPLGLIYG